MNVMSFLFTPLLGFVYFLSLDSTLDAYYHYNANRQSKQYKQSECLLYSSYYSNIRYTVYRVHYGIYTVSRLLAPFLVSSYRAGGWSSWTPTGRMYQIHQMAAKCSGQRANRQKWQLW